MDTFPKTVHVIWLQGYAQLPEHLKDNYLQLQSLNLDYTFMFWDDDSIQKIIKEVDSELLTIYLNINKLSGSVSDITSKSDIARFVILFYYGGVYTDIDIKCTVPFKTILSFYQCNFIIGDNEYRLLKFIPFLKYRPKYYAGFIICIKEHPLWKPIFEQIKKAKSRNRIGESVDRYIQENKIEVCVFKQSDISSHTSCQTGKCYFPSQSSWFTGRSVLIKLACNIEIIIVFIVFLIIIYKRK